jgi:HD-GYP domain-containing protein (c-di-GMP phosphodiesterase class II)
MTIRMTPQPAADLFDAPWTAERLREIGVCLTDRDWTPLGAADDFFLRYALPALKRDGMAAGVTTAVAEIETGRRRRKSVGLVAFSGSLPPVAMGGEGHSRLTAALPAYAQAALDRLAANLPSFLSTRSRLAEARQELDALSAQLADTYEELSLVYQIGSNMTVNSPTASFLRAACETTLAVMEIKALGVLVWDERLPPQPPHVFGRATLSEPQIARLDAVLRQMMGQPGEEGSILINDAASIPQLAWMTPETTQLLAVPMRRHGQTLGCLFGLDKDVPREIFGTFNRGVFTSMDRKFLEGVAVHIALFLENRKLFKDSESLMMGLLHSLVAAVDAKDAYTRGHSVRVGLFAKRLALEAGYDQSFAERVYFAGLLHDVGKIGIDDAVLRKAGRLTEEEFAQIRRHPEIGYRILKGIPQIHDILPGVLYHHEKFDATGYPEKLGGERIPLLGRILCIADSFDAMTSSRTYRTGMSIEDALAEIGRCSGSHFDPRLAARFCAIPTAQIRELVRTERENRLPDFRLLQEAA